MLRTLATKPETSHAARDYEAGDTDVPQYMPPYDDDDSDFEEDVYSNVQLGLADGPLEEDDESNPLVSRIGGRPAWLPLQPSKLPPASEVQCAYCKEPMQLLIQIFAPLEDSAYDRNLFVWGCLLYTSPSPRD